MSLPRGVRAPYRQAKVKLDEVRVAQLRALVARDGAGRVTLLLRSSPTTLEKMLCGFPLLEATAQRLGEKIEKLAARAPLT